jgi:hypothetical protein
MYSLYSQPEADRYVVNAILNTNQFADLKYRISYA